MTRRVVLALLLALAVLVPAAHAATGTGTTTLPNQFTPKGGPAQLSEKRVTAIFLRDDKVADWLDRYPRRDLVTDATFDKDRRDWGIGVWSSAAGEIATGRVDDETGAVTEAWTGPQVAWKMARGSSGAFGGREINSLPIWLGLCVIFLIGLADFRKPLTMRNLDLVVLLSFSVSLWFFNRGDIFTAVPLRQWRTCSRGWSGRPGTVGPSAGVRFGRSGCSPRRRSSSSDSASASTCAART
jgi:hypothetical protein